MGSSATQHSNGYHICLLLICKISKNFAILKKIVNIISRENLRNVYYSFIYPGHEWYNSLRVCTVGAFFITEGNHKVTIIYKNGSGKLNHTAPL